MKCYVPQMGLHKCNLGATIGSSLLHAVYLPRLVLILMISKKSVLHQSIPIGMLPCHHPTYKCEHMVRGRKEAKSVVHREHGNFLGVSDVRNW